MLLPVEWLEDFMDIRETPEELSRVLTMIGLEIEGGETPEGTDVFEVNITPNRPDCLSVLGIARELRAATGRPLRMPDVSVDEDGEGDFRVIIDSPLCSRYCGRIITGVSVGESPAWLKRRLELSGIRSINNIVDITNYVLLELGHPLHAFDLERLKGRTVRVDTAGAPLRFRTLDGTERDIPGDGLLIWDAERPVAVAGIMGGIETEVSRDTRALFLESAHFNPLSIRRTSKALGLKTESSYRFERGTDIEGLSTALDRAAHLIQRLCGGTVSRKIDMYPGKPEETLVRLRYGRLDRLLGLHVPEGRVREILQLLGFTLISPGDDELVVKVPTYRVDVRDETDLVEEVARHYGYGKIPVQIPHAPVGKGTSPSGFAAGARKTREIMRNSGFNEAINYSFMNPALLDLLNIPDGDDRRRLVTLLNPISKEAPALRTFLLPSLMENLVRNLNHGVRDIKLFEISRVFTGRGEKLPVETPLVGAIHLYQQGQRLWEDSIEVYYILKGVAEKLLKVFHKGAPSFRPTSEPFLHPGKSADLYVGDERLGYVGCLAPGITKRLDLKHVKSPVGVLELDLGRLAAVTGEGFRYTPVPRFPYVQRDISLLVDNTITAEEILSLIRSFPSGLIEDSWVFDVYEGGKIPAGKRSLAFRIQYRSSERTLTDEEIDPLHQEITEYLVRKTGGRLRA